MDKRKAQDLQGRRNFLKGAMALGVAGAASGANALSGAGTEPAAAACEPAWLKAPEPISDSKIGKTVTADVVVIGSALSGLSAARAALEAGATVAVIEKAPDMVYRSTDVGMINSSIAQKLGCHYDPAEVVTAIQDYYSWRTSADLWRYWAENSGAALDWWLSLVPDYKLVDESFNVPSDTKDVYVRMPHWPHPKPFDLATEHYKCFSTSHQIMPDMGIALRAVQTKCKELGGSLYYSTWARQLIRPNNDGRVLGAIAQQKDGSYIKFLAKRGVVLCTGDYSGDRSMVEHYCPQAADLYPHAFFPNKDANGIMTNTGDGQKMGMWIGAQMERGPHAPMTHCIGGPLGDDAFLLVNVRGERFMNEDNDGQRWTNAIERQPKAQAFQIFDARWKKQLECQGISHGMVNSVGAGGGGLHERLELENHRAERAATGEDGRHT
jgi:succinate dehydrogenase/fumarate reductase flavoprotein subunit